MLNAPPPPFPILPSQHPSPASTKTLPQNLTITPVTPSLLPSYRRIITLLLPIRYPDTFYKEAIGGTTSTSLARCAIWHDNTPQRPAKRKRLDSTNTERIEQDDEADEEDKDGQMPQRANEKGEEEGEGKVVAAIQCRLEPLSPPTSPSVAFTPRMPKHPLKHAPLNIENNNFPANGNGHQQQQRSKQQLYIQTLCTLSPYRDRGIASALLEDVLAAALLHHSLATPLPNVPTNHDIPPNPTANQNLFAHVEPLPKNPPPPINAHSSSGGDPNIRSIYAHVWEANTEALEWYIKRGFVVEAGTVEGYYRRLRPSGARVVRRGVGVGDWVRARARTKVEVEVVDEGIVGRMDGVGKGGVGGVEVEEDEGLMDGGEGEIGDILGTQGVDGDGVGIRGLNDGRSTDGSLRAEEVAL